MSLSNRVSLDTDVLFVRNMFVFSTNTNNVPVSTNTILAIGPNGQMVASNTLYNLSTYGVGYLPSTLSSLEGEIVSVGNIVLAGGVTPAQLISVQTALQSSISSTQGSVDTLSSYILLNVIPSTTSTFDSQISSLNSSFQGYVGGTSVTPVQLQSTYTASVDYTNSQISTLSTNTQNQINALSNYFDVSSATVTQFSTLSGNVSAQSNYFSTQIYLTNSNFNALSTSTRLLNISNSTLIGNLENDVSTLTTLVVNTSTVTTPLGTLSLLSTVQCSNWPFFSNIKVSSIDVRADGTAAAPAINFTSGGDNDTGLYHPGDGIIAFTTNGSERLRLNANALTGSTFINLYGTSNGFAALNPYNAPVMTLTSGCNDNGNSVTISMNMPSTAFRTFVGGGTGIGLIAYRQLQTFANDLTAGGTSNLATSIHSTGNFAIKAPANGSNALYVNGSTFIGGQLVVSTSGAALNVNGSTIMNGPLFVSTGVSALNVNGSTFMNGQVVISTGVSALNVNGSTIMNGPLFVSTAGSALNVNGSTFMNGQVVVSTGVSALNINGSTIMTGPLFVSTAGSALNVNGSTFMNGQVVISTGGSALNINGSTIINGPIVVSTGGSVLNINGSTIINGQLTVSTAGSSLNVNGSTFMNGPLFVSTGGSALNVNGSTIMNGPLFVSTGVSALNVNGSTFMNGQVVVSTGVSALNINGSTIMTGPLFVSTAGSALNVNGSTFMNGQVVVSTGVSALNINGSTIMTGPLFVSTGVSALNVNGSTFMNGQVVVSTGVSALNINGSTIMTGPLFVSTAGSALNVNGSTFMNGQVVISTGGSALNINGSTIMNGPLVVSTGGSVLNINGSTIINGQLTVSTAGSSLNVNGSTFINGQLTVSTGGSALYVNGSTFINGRLGISTSGSAAVPAMYFSELGDDTGFFTPGDGAIGITTNGGERFRFAAAQLIGCNSEIVLNGLNQGTLSLFPNTIEPQIELKTTSAVGNPNISWSNSAVNYKTFLAGPTSGSIAANNQLMTYAYPGTSLAIAVHSTGNIAIKAAANTSNALYVNGSTFINGQLTVSTTGSALNINGSTFINGQLTVSTGGSALYVNGSTFINGQLGISTAGSALAPSIYFTETATDTGIFHPGDGIIAYTTNGVERYRLSGNEIRGSTFLTFYGASSGQVSLNPIVQPSLTLTSGCNHNSNSVCLQMFMPSTAFKTFVGGETGAGGIEYRQLQTFAYDLTTGGSGTINLATSIHSTGNFAIKAVANGSDALYVNGSTFINGQLGVSAPGSASKPSIYFTDTGSDTGFFRPADGAIGIATNASERFRFQAAEFIGCNSDIVLNGTTADFKPNINLNTTNTGGSPHISWSNTDVNYRIFVASRTGTGFDALEKNQLVTYAYSGGISRSVIAIHSTGTVGIRGAADPTFALTVNGGIRQTAPYIWEYYLSSNLPAQSYSTIIYNISNYEPDGPTSLISSSRFVLPYTGVYTLGIEASVTGSGGVTYDLRTSLITLRSTIVAGSEYTNLTFTSSFTSLTSISVFAQINLGQDMRQPKLRIQYWG